MKTKTANKLTFATVILVALSFQFVFSQDLASYSKRADVVSAFKAFPKSKHKDFVSHVFYCDENKKLKEFSELLTPDGFIAFGSNPKVVGRKNVENMLIDFNKSFKHLSQHIIKVYADNENEIIYEADATYDYNDGTKSQAFPYMVHLIFKGDLVSDYRIFIDLGPFFQKVSGK